MNLSDPASDQYLRLVEDPVRALRTFWGHVLVGGDGECWPYQTDSSHQNGTRFCLQGRTSEKRQYVSVRRFAYSVCVGHLQPSQRVTTTCGEPWCVNPAHLHAFVPGSPGSRLYASNRRKASDELVLFVRENYKAGETAILAERTGLSTETISRIVCARSYKHLGGPRSKKRCGKPKLTEETVRDIRSMRGVGATYQQIASKHGVSIHTVYRVCKMETWKDVR